MKGFIYAIFDWTSGLFKIGFSRDPEKLFRRLCEQPDLLPAPHDFYLMDVIPGHPDTVRRFREAFEAYRVRGDWFSLSSRQYAEFRLAVKDDLVNPERYYKPPKKPLVWKWSEWANETNPAKRIKNAAVMEADLDRRLGKDRYKGPAPE